MPLITIKKRADFVNISKNNICYYSSTILLLAQKTPEKYLASPKDGKITDLCRVGYTVSKAAGKAVIRNKIKRRYREAFRALYAQHTQNHFDYVLISRRETAKSSFKKISDDLKFCLKGINKLLKNDSKPQSGTN